MRSKLFKTKFIFYIIIVSLLLLVGIVYIFNRNIFLADMVVPNKRCVRVKSTWLDKTGYESTTIKEMTNLLVTIDTPTETETFPVPITVPKVDMLWVVDNSRSMEDDQANMATNFDSFIQKFVTKNIDYRIGITTVETTHKPSYPSYIDQTLPTAQNGSFWRADSTSKYIINSTMGAAAVKTYFKRNILVGTTGKGREKMLEAAKYALDKTRLASSVNYGFIRNNSDPKLDAYLAIILICDENDQSLDSTQSYIRAIKAFKSDPRKVTIYVIGDTTKADQEADDPYSSTIDTPRYLEDYYKSGGSGFETLGVKRDRTAAVETGGFVRDITSRDYYQSLLDISDDILNQTTSFLLDGNPIVGTIQVFVKVGTVETEIPEDPATGWVYSQVKRAILFIGDYTPPPGAVIRVTYEQ